jgi:hypothetical protein
MADKKIHEGYGGTSEQRQRHLHGDGFSERAPHTAQESEAERATPGDAETIVTLHPLGEQDAEGPSRQG